jgi:lysophospholipase L1-like esterase
MSNEQVRWLLKVIQPERTLASLPGGASFSQNAHAGLLGLPVEIYATELDRMQKEASEAAGELLADQVVASMIDRLPLRQGAKVVVFGDSLTSEPQSWAVILREMLAMRRGTDGISLTISAVAGETTTHGLVRAGVIANFRPDWILFLLGTNDARTQGSHPTKTLVNHQETARNIAELRQRVSRETSASCVWITHPAVNEARVAVHAGLAKFGVRFRNEDLERVASIVRDGDGPVIDAFSILGSPPPTDLLMGDGLHFTLAGQKRMALEVIRGWSTPVRLCAQCKEGQSPFR